MQNIWPGSRAIGILNNMVKTIGILGGMGPYATIDLFQKIVSNTPAKIEQDHHQIIIYNNPIIPSRMEAFNKQRSQKSVTRINSISFCFKACWD